MAEQWPDPEQATHPVAVGLGVGGILAAMAYVEARDAVRERNFVQAQLAAQRGAARTAKPRSTARKPRVVAKGVTAKAVAAPQPNILIRGGDRILQTGSDLHAGQNDTYRNKLPPGSGRFNRALHAVERFGPHQIFAETFPLGPRPVAFATQGVGLAVKGAGHTVAAASKLSADLHAKNAGKVYPPAITTNYGAINVAGMGVMGFGLAAAGLSRAGAAHEAGASTPRVIAAAAAGVLDAAKVPIGVGLGLAAVGKFAGLGTKMLLGRGLFWGSLAYNVGSQLVSSMQAGKTGAADLGEAALTGFGHTLMDVDSMRAGVQAWKNWKPAEAIPPPDFQGRRMLGGPKDGGRQSTEDQRIYAAANERYKAMRAAAGETDTTKRRKGWTDAARIGSYRSRVPSGSNAPYGGQVRDVA